MKIFIVMLALIVSLIFAFYIYFKRNIKLVIVKLIQKDLDKGIMFLRWYYKIKIVHNRSIRYKVLISWLKKWNPDDKFEKVIKSSLILYLNKDKEDTTRLDVCASIYIYIRQLEMVLLLTKL